MRKCLCFLLICILSCFLLNGQNAFEKDVQLLSGYVQEGDTASIRSFYSKYEKLYQEAVFAGNEESIVQNAFIFSLICEACDEYDLDYLVSLKGFTLAKKNYPKEYGLLTFFCQRLCTSGLQTKRTKEALEYANKGLSYSKLDKENPSNYILSLVVSAQTYSETGNIQKAYRLIKEAYSYIHEYNDPTANNVCNAYLSILSSLALEAAERGQESKIEEYYDEAQRVQETNSAHGGAFLLDEDFFNGIIRIKMQKDDRKTAYSIANARTAAARKAYERYTPKDDAEYLNPVDYSVAMPLSFASEAYENEDLLLYYCYLETAYLNSQKPGVSKEYRSYVLAPYAPHAAYVKNDYKEAFDCYWAKFKLDEELDADLNTLSQDLSEIIYFAFVATNYVRFFHKNSHGDPNSGDFIPVLPQKMALYILDQWEIICSYIEDNYTASLYREVAETVCNWPQDYRVFPMFSRNDLKLMRGHYAVYYRDYALFDRIVPDLIEENHLDDTRITDLIWRIDNNLFLNYDFSSAQDFLSHIKELGFVKDNPAVLQWVENESPYLADWVNQEIIRAQGLTSEGKIDDAVQVYDNILTQVEKTEGRSENYAYTLCSKGIDLYLTNILDDAKEVLESACSIASVSSKDNYDIRYSALKGLLATYSKLGDYSNVQVVSGLAESFLMEHPEGNDNYSYYDERCYVYWKRAEAARHLLNKESADRLIQEGLAFFYSNEKNCSALSRINLLSEQIEEYCEIAENALNNGDGNICLDYFVKSISIIQDNPDLLNDYKYIIGKQAIFQGSLLELNKKKGNYLNDFINHYLDLDNKVYQEAISNNQPVDPYDVWRYFTYYNLASYCWHAGVAAPAIDLFDETIKQVRLLSEIPKYGDDEIRLMDYQYIISKDLLKDHPKSIQYKVKEVLQAIEEYGSLDSLTFETFDNAYVAYTLPIASGTNFSLGTMEDAVYPHLSYEDNLSIIKLWRETQDTIESRYGQRYLDSLYRYSLNRSNDYSVSHGGAFLGNTLEHMLPPRALSLRDELYLNISFNRIEEMQRCMGDLFSELEETGLSITDELFYRIICDISSEIEHRGYLDIAISFLYSYYSEAQEQDAFELCERITTQLGQLAWRAGNNDVLFSCVAPAALLSSQWQGYDQYKAFYDVNELLAQLILASRLFANSDKELATELLSIAERLINEDQHCINDRAATVDSKELFYSELASTADNLETVEHAYEMIAQIDTTWLFSNTLNLASIYAYNGKYEESRELLQQVKDYINTYHYIEPRWRIQALDCQMNIDLYDNDVASAHTALQEKLNITERDFFSTTLRLSDLSRTNYWDKYYSYTLEDFTTNNLRIDGNWADVSFDAAIFHKGILKRMRTLVQNNVRSSSDESLKRLYEDYANALKSGSDSLAQKENAFMYQYFLHPEFVEMISLTTWQDVQNSLKKGEMAIEYTLSLESETNELILSAIILKKDSKAPKIIRLTTENTLKELLDRTRQSNGYSIAYDLYDTSGNELYKLVWEPLESELKGIKTIYFSPYAELNSISVEALRKNERSKCLFELYNMVRVSSTEEICYQKFASVSNAIVFGDIDYDHTSEEARVANTSQSNVFTSDETILPQDEYNNLRALRGEWSPLSGTKDEIESISSMLANNSVKVDIFTKEEGTEEIFKSYSSKPVSMIHLATHGYYFNNADAMRIDYFNKYNKSDFISSGLRSGIIFSGANNAWKGLEKNNEQEDGILTADEILGMDLSSTDLLVLSACQSALGDSGSDGVYGIQRSFKIAGVNSIIMSLWEVDDEATSIMMKSFYWNYMGGKTKREAFKAAQLEVRQTYEGRAKDQSKDIPRSRRYDSSYYWASFILLD